MLKIPYKISTVCGDLFATKADFVANHSNTAMLLDSDASMALKGIVAKLETLMQNELKMAHSLTAMSSKPLL